MRTRPILLTAVVTTLLRAGCSHPQPGGDPFAAASADPRAAGPAAHVAGRTGGDEPQTAYRRELLMNQLQQSRLDLQAASSAEERASVQERIDIIQRQLKVLGGEQHVSRKVTDEGRVNVASLARQSRPGSARGDLQARDAAYIAGQPVTHTQQSLFPANIRDAEGAAAEHAANLLLQSQVSRKSLNEAGAQRRLRELELELQLADDEASKDALAREIAEMRLQIAESDR